jgi:hypothetical protein
VEKRGGWRRSIDGKTEIMRKDPFGWNSKNTLNHEDNVQYGFQARCGDFVRFMRQFSGGQI